MIQYKIDEKISERRVAIEFSGETRNHGFRERPRLAAEVLDVLDTNARFFKDFALDGLLQRFADFNESRNEVHARFVWIVQIAGHQKLVAIVNSDNHDRRNLGIDGVLAAGANHGAFLEPSLHETSTFTAELVQAFPLSNVCRRGASEAFQMAFECAECAIATKFVAFRNFRQVRIAQEISVIVDANQVMAFALREFAHTRNGEVVASLFEKCLLAIENNQVISGLGLNGLKFVIQLVRSNFVNHRIVNSYWLLFVMADKIRHLFFLEKIFGG